MIRTLIIFVHPALEKSTANRALLEGVSSIDGVTVHDLYEMYPDFHIDVAKEKALLEAHDRIIWQFPFYWYSSPALLKEWFDVVLQYGWAFGLGGKALEGKTARVVTTTG
ncbi:MAG: glutathione-regulated potassium-efflux system ancillary protein KefG, partial [Candidatus Pelagisphaera sp.]